MKKELLLKLELKLKLKLGFGLWSPSHRQHGALARQVTHENEMKMTAASDSVAISG